MDEIERGCMEEKKKGKIDEWMSDIIKSIFSEAPGSIARDAEKAGAAYHDAMEENVDEAYNKLVRMLSEKYPQNEREDIISCIEDYTDAVREMHFSLGLEFGVALHENLKGSIKSEK